MNTMLKKLKNLSLIVAIFCVSNKAYSALATAEAVAQGTAIIDLKQAFPYDGKVVIKSKSVRPIYLMFFNGNFKNLATVKAAQGDSSLIELKENEQIVLREPKKGSSFSVLVSSDKSKLDAALALTDTNKRHDFIWSLIKSETTDMNYFNPSINEVYLVYKNNAGLIPGLLRGAGESKNKTFTKMGKLSTLRLVYKDKNNFMLVQKPKEYSDYAQKGATKSSPLPTIEGVVDDVVSFEKAKNY